MHLSHIHEDLEAWYLNFDFDERVATAFRPEPRRAGRTRRPCRRGRQDVSTAARRRAATTDELGPDRPQRLDPDDLAPRSRTSSPRRDASTRRGRRSRSAPTSTRSTTRSRGRSEPDEIGATPGGRRALRRLQPDRATTSTATGSRWTACCPAARSRSRRGDREQGFNSVLSHDAPPELPRAAAAAPQLPARRV